MRANRRKAQDEAAIANKAEIFSMLAEPELGQQKADHGRQIALALLAELGECAHCPQRGIARNEVSHELVRFHLRQVVLGWHVPEDLAIGAGEECEIAEPVGDELVIAVGIAIENRPGKQAAYLERFFRAVDELSAQKRAR